MAKKFKKEKIPLLHFLLREFKGREISKETERESTNKKETLEKLVDKKFARLENKTTSLLLALLRDVRKRPDPEEEKNFAKDEPVREEGEDEDLEESIMSDDTERSLLKERFEVLPTKPIGEDYLRRASEVIRNYGTPQDMLQGEFFSQTKSTGNYSHSFSHQHAREEELTAEKNRQIEEAKRKEQEEAAKRAEAQKAIDAAKIRARELQNQIAWWKQQVGLGQYDETTINANIDLLQRELNNIPPGLW